MMFLQVFQYTNLNNKICRGKIIMCKKISIVLNVICVGSLVLFSCGQNNNSENDNKDLTNSNTGWRENLNEQLPKLGHRNWILVADAAYPSYSSSGILTVATGKEMDEVLNEVLALVNSSNHIRANIYLDKEIDYVDEEHAPGIEAFRNNLEERLAQYPVQRIMHEELIKRLDDASKYFSVLVLKTKLTIPYTSVFLELGCGYWDDESEQSLRERMR